MIKTTLLLFIILTLFPKNVYSDYTDPLLQFLYSTQVREVTVSESIDDTVYYDAEPEHYSWDNLYLCDYCDIEVIVDPYVDIREDGVYDINYGHW